MYRSTISFILLSTILALTISEEIPKGNCSCSVMQKGDLNPILKHSLQYKVDCNHEGADACQKLCVALAQSATEKAPILICEKLNQTVTDFQVELYSKICNETGWKSSNFENTESLCCEEGKPTTCP